MSSYTFHPDAFADRDEIWEYIAENNVDAADRVLADIHLTLTTLAGSSQIGQPNKLYEGGMKIGAEHSSSFSSVWLDSFGRPASSLRPTSRHSTPIID